MARTEVRVFLCPRMSYQPSAPAGVQDQAKQRPPLLFVHGSFHAAWCWREHFMPHFAAAGWDTLAVSLRGQVSKQQPGSVAQPLHMEHMHHRATCRHANGYFPRARPCRVRTVHAKGSAHQCGSSASQVALRAS